MELENWRTGRIRDPSDWHALLNLVQVLDLSSKDGSELVGPQAVFLDEFRIVVIPERLAIKHLAVFDTLIPQDHPGYLRRLLFPLEFRRNRSNITIYVDHDRDLGTPNKDKVLLPDPAQAVVIVELGGIREPHVLLVVRTQALVKQVHYSSVPWDEWGRDAVAIRVQNNFSRSYTFVHGAQVMIGRALLPHGLGGYDVRTFDFGKRGCGSLPLRGGDDGTERRVLFEDGANLVFEPDDGLNLRVELRSLSDGSLMYLVSFPAQRIGGGANATVNGGRGVGTTRTTSSRFGNCVENITGYRLYVSFTTLDRFPD